MLPNLNALNENQHGPLAQSQQHQNPQNICPIIISGHENSQSNDRQSHAQMHTYPDSYQLLERLKELYATLSHIERELSYPTIVYELNIIH